MSEKASFESLAKVDRELAKVARECAGLVSSNPAQAVANLRVIGESLADMVAPLVGLNREPRESQFALLGRLAKRGINDRNVLSRFHKIRVEAERAKSEGRSDIRTFIDCAVAVEEIADWLHGRLELLAQQNAARPTMGATIAAPLRMVAILCAIAAVTAVVTHGLDIRQLARLEVMPDSLRLGWGVVELLLVLWFTYWIFAARGRGAPRRVSAGLGMLIGPVIGLAGVFGWLGSSDATPEWMWMSAGIVIQVCLAVGLTRSAEISERRPARAPLLAADATGPSDTTSRAPVKRRVNIVVGDGGGKPKVESPVPPAVSPPKPAPAAAPVPSPKPSTKAPAPFKLTPSPVASALAGRDKPAESRSRQTSNPTPRTKDDTPEKPKGGVSWRA